MVNKIVLLQPKAGEWEFIGVRPPDSLLAVAAEPNKEGYKIKIIDQRIDKNWKEILKRELKDTMLFGTTAMTGPQIKYALEASKFVKENSDVPVVWGGVHASLMPEQTIQNKYIDIIIKGEGDFVLLDIIKAIEKGKNLKECKIGILGITLSISIAIGLPFSSKSIIVSSSISFVLLAFICLNCINNAFASKSKCIFIMLSLTKTDEIGLPFLHNT